MKSRFWMTGAVLAALFIGLFVRFWRHQPESAPDTKPLARKANSSARKSGNGFSFGDWYAEASRRLRDYDKDNPRAAPNLSPRTFAGRDATNLATHPAWQLAARLNNAGEIAFTNPVLVSPDVSVSASFAGANGFDISGLNRFVSSSGAIINTESSSSERVLQRWLDGGGQNGVTIFARELARLEREAQTQQSAGVNGFLLAAANRQQTRRDQIADSLRSAARDDVELARRLDPGALEPFLPSEAEALRLINLRLDLLATLRTSATQKRDAAQERLERETAFRAALREQELERARLLDQLQNTLPQRLTAQRQRALEITLREIALRDEETRQGAVENQRELIAQDFSARNAPLGIALPSRAPKRLAGADTSASTWARDSGGNSNRTARAQVPSNADNFAVSGVEGAKSFVAPSSASERLDVANGSGRASVLARNLALNDVRQWQRIAARRQQAWRAVNQTNELQKSLAKPVGLR